MNSISCFFWRLFFPNTPKVVCEHGRFKAVFDPARRDIEGKHSRVHEVFFKGTDGEWKLFANVWEVKRWCKELNGTWTLNREKVCIDADWCARTYTHISLKEMLIYFEKNFPQL